MATYKVIQDIEAEDKLLGPLTLRQFIYAIIVVVTGFIIFRLSIAGLWPVAILFVPITVFFSMLAAPFGQDQPSEVWLLAKIRFALKPRKRIWNQSGVKELVTITVPKKVEHVFTNGLTQTEVKSRLQALADTIDSRGWAVKNVNVNLFDHPSYAAASTDRLINPSTLPQDVSTSDVTAMDDMLDERNNPAAQQLNQMMTASAQAHRQQVVSRLQQPAPPASPGPGQATAPPPDYWFLSQNQSATPPAGFATIDSRVVAPGQANTNSSKRTTPDEEALLQQLHAKENANKGNNPTYGHMRTLQPLSAQDGESNYVPANQAATSGAQTPAPQPAAAPDPAIVELANNDDLNVATIARQAEKARKKEPPKDEVVVSLH